MIPAYAPGVPAVLSGGLKWNPTQLSPSEMALLELSQFTGESKTEAIRRALEERKQRLAFQVVRENRGDELRSFLEREVWSVIRARSASRRLEKH